MTAITYTKLSLMETYTSEEGQHLPVRDQSPTSGDDDSRWAVHTPSDTITSKAARVIRPYRSLDDIPGSKTTAPAVVRLHFSQLARQTLELDKSLKDEARLRANFDSKRQQYQQDSKTYRIARSTYETANDPFRTRSDPATADDSIAKLRQSLIDHRSLFETGASGVRVARKQLQEAQKSREACERRLIIFARPWALTIDFQPLAHGNAGFSDARDAHHATAQTLAPLIRDFDSLMHLYHQKVADIKSLGEQLADQNDEYWNDVARREIRRDQGDQLSVTESDFDTDWKRRKDSLAQELSSTINEANRIREECIITSDTRIDLRAEDFPDLRSIITPDLGLESETGFEQSLQGALSRIPAEAFENAEVIRDDYPDNVSDTDPNTEINDVVSQWRDSVPAGQML